MNRIEVLAATPAIGDMYEATIDTSVECTPATLHAVGRLLEGFGCTHILQLTINGKGADNEQ